MMTFMTIIFALIFSIIFALIFALIFAVAFIRVMIIVIFMAPVPLVEVPSFGVVIVVRVLPVGARVRWLVPVAAVPAVSTLPGLIEAVYPGVTWAGGQWPRLVAHGRWGTADINADLG